MMLIDKEENVLQKVLLALESGQLLLSFHAMEHKDVQHQNSSTKSWSWRYAIRGRNDSGEKDLRIIVVIENPKTVIITVIDLDKRE